MKWQLKRYKINLLLFPIGKNPGLHKAARDYRPCWLPGKPVYRYSVINGQNFDPGRSLRSRRLP